jgi:hypothetical protein
MREPLFGCAVGRKGVGKTYTTLKMISNYLKGNPAAGIKPRRVLILDVNDEFSTFKAISVSDIAKFCKSPLIEARRVRAYNPTGKPMSLDEVAQTLSLILSQFRGGLLLIEDINKFISDNMNKDIIGTLVTTRHIDVDVICHFQNVGRIAHPKIWGNLNWVRFHKTDDTIKRHMTKFGGETEHMEIAEMMVNINYFGGNERFYCYFDKDKGKIKGNFTKKEFMEAVDKYLSENYKRVVSPEINRINLLTGKRMYSDHKQAVESIRSKFLKDYYGNAK